MDNLHHGAVAADKGREGILLLAVDETAQELGVGERSLQGAVPGT